MSIVGVSSGRPTSSGGAPKQRRALSSVQSACLRLPTSGQQREPCGGLCPGSGLQLLAKRLALDLGAPEDRRQLVDEHDAIR
jgi:hypothetical protein